MLKHSFILILILLCFNTIVMGQSNYSLFFNGINNYVEFPFADNHDLFEDFSIEVWLKFDTIPDGKILSKVGWFDPGDSVSSYSIYFDETEPYRVIFSTWVGTSPNVEHKAISNLPLISKQWHYITVTYTEANSTKKIYIDGVLTYNEDNTGDIGYNRRPLFIGAFKTNLGDIIFPFKGNIDEVRIWKKTLSQNEIIFNMYNPVIGNEDSLLGLWHFNEGIGDTLYDSTMYNINGAIYGASWEEGYIITSIAEPNFILNDFRLFQNYPNPFNPITKIKFSIPKSDVVKIKVYDVLGKEILAILNEYKQAGTYDLEFTENDLPSGVYFYKLQAGNYSETKKMVIIK